MKAILKSVFQLSRQVLVERMPGENIRSILLVYQASGISFRLIYSDKDDSEHIAAGVRLQGQIGYSLAIYAVKVYMPTEYNTRIYGPRKLTEPSIVWVRMKTILD